MLLGHNLFNPWAKDTILILFQVHSPNAQRKRSTVLSWTSSSHPKKRQVRQWSTQPITVTQPGGWERQMAQQDSCKIPTLTKIRKGSCERQYTLQCNSWLLVHYCCYTQVKLLASIWSIMSGQNSHVNSNNDYNSKNKVHFTSICRKQDFTH